MAVSQYIELKPDLPEQAHHLLAPLWNVLQHPRYLAEDLSQAFRHVRQGLMNGLNNHADRLVVRLFVELLEDLVDQGWQFKAVVEGKDRLLKALPPGARNGRPIEQEEVKRRIRASLVAARNEQLREDAVRRFVLDMERPRWHRGRQVSVQDLLVSPRALAEDLQRRLDAPPSIRDELLRDAVSPYLQHATEAPDEFTGLRLIDIWRYCRYTWSMPFHGQPGRRMYYLIRDAARDHHPIIGIGALGNSIVQIKCRDERIGWTLSSLKHAVDAGARMAALEAEIDHAIADVFWEDLVSAEEVETPGEETIARLEDVVARMPKASERQQGEVMYDTLVDEAQSPRYTRKRAQVLHGLLRAKRTLQQAAGVASSPEERASWLLRSEDGRRALKMALRSLKKRHVGSSIMDITTCGALPPYGTLLGGKLVSLLMASPQVIADYRLRYADASSVIASRMKGDEVVRSAHLVLLGTTSLYHVGSSQYNRLRAPVAHGALAFDEVGKTLGFGSVHLSRRTYQTVQELLRDHPELGQQSNRFAAGVNYKIRSIAAALSWLGMSKLQQHHMPRLVYLAPLAVNWQAYLTGVDKTPAYLFEDLDDPTIETQRLIDYWKERWFTPRVQKPYILRRLKDDPLPARVSDALRRDDFHDAGPLFWDYPGDGATEAAVSSTVPSTPMSTASKISWKTLAELVGDRASFAERLTKQELEVLHVPTRLDESLVSAVSQGCRVYLSGNPGDGKTHIIRKLEERLSQHGAFVHLDASAADEQQLLDKLHQVAQDQAPAVIAINEGPLRRIANRLPEPDRQEILDQLARPFLYTEEKEPEYTALLVNMGVRQVLTDDILEGTFELVLNRVDYSDAPEQVRENWQMLGMTRVRERLLALLKYVARSGGHVTMHQLLGFLGFIITGGEKTVERAAKIGPYYQSAFDPANALSRWIEGFDPAAISHPLVDMNLWDGDNEGKLEWLRGLPGLPPAKRTNSEEAAAVFTERKRCYYFEERNGHSLFAMIPADRKQFFEVLDKSQQAQETAKVQLLEALSYFYGDPGADEHGEQLQIWTSLRYEALGPPTSFLSSIAIGKDEIGLRVPRLRRQVAELLEYEPDHVRLVVAPPNIEAQPPGLDIDLSLWLALSKIKRGMPQRYHDPVIGRRLEDFMSRVAAQRRSRRGGYAQLHVRDVERGSTYRIDVSLELKKYRI